MSMEVAGLYTTLTMADEAFVAATTREGEALERVAVASETTSAKVKAGAAEQGAAEEALAVKTEATQGRMARGWADLTKSIEDHGSKTTQVWSKVTHAGELSGLALIGIGAESVHLASDFQSSMMLIRTQAGDTTASIANLSQQVLALAPTVGQGPDKLAEGLYHIESAGFRGQEAMDILAASAKDASIGMSDMETTSQALIGTMAVGFSDVKNAADAAAFLNTTVGIGDMRMEKLAAAISTGVLPSFKSAGLGMTDFSAALATLTDNVTPADEAATRLRMTVALLAAPSQQAFKALTAVGLGAEEANGALANRSALEKYGISISQLSTDLHKPDGLLVATEDLKSHLESAGLTAAEQTAVINKAFGGGRTAGAITTLLEESDRLKSKYDAIGTSATRSASMQKAWTDTQGTFKQQMHDLGAQLQVIGIQIGNKLLPPLTKLFGFLASHTTLMKVFFAIIVAGMVAFTVAVVANTVAMLANPTTYIILAIVAVIAILVIGIFLLVKHWSTVWGFIKRIALDVWHWLVDAWHTTIHGIEVAAGWVKSKIIDPIVHWFKEYLVAPIVFYLKIVRGVWEFAWGFLKVIIGDFKKEWDVFWAGVTAVANWAWNNILKPVFDFIDKYGIRPLRLAIAIFKLEWQDIWKHVVQYASDAWDFLKLIWGYIDKYGIQPLHEALSFLATQWDKLWNGIKSTLETIWDHTLKPIFDKIGAAIDKVVGGFKAIADSPGKAGSAFAHFLGFDQGGWVPGAPGSPMLAIVHGGEFVVSRDMLAGRSATPIQVGRTAGPVGAGAPAPSIVHQHVHVYIDGKEIQNVTMKNGNRHKLRNGNNGYGS